MLIKICGLTRLADASLAVALGADRLGFIFFPPSPRAVTPGQVAAILADLPASTRAIGVFVNADFASIMASVRAAGLRGVQLHGHEPPELAAALLAEGLEVIKVLPLNAERVRAGLTAFPGCTLLVDTPSAAHGGSGQVGDWELARQAARAQPLWLAGGLTPENVAAAIASVQPAGVDVVSGVEASKGIKDHDKLRRFVAAVRETENRP